MLTAAQLPPTKGVVHIGHGLRDALFENMAHEEWTVSLRPKVPDTRNLHEYFGHERASRLHDFLLVYFRSLW